MSTNLKNAFADARKTARLPLAGGLFTDVDCEDFETLSAHKWHALRNGGRIYARSSINIDGRFRSVLMHRMLMTPAPGLSVDHINGNGLDNRRSNLRLATAAENARNSVARTKCGFTGVHKVGGRWQASISPNGLSIYLGMYDSPERAAQAYNAAATHIYGDFARLNPVPHLDDAIADAIEERRARLNRIAAELAALGG